MEENKEIHNQQEKQIIQQNQNYNQNFNQAYNQSVVPNTSAQQTGERKTGIGVLCGFIGLIGLIVGLCSYKEETVERKSFLKGWGITFGITVGLSFILTIIYYVLIFSI